MAGEAGTSVGVITLDLRILNTIQAQLDGIAAGVQKSAQQSFARVGDTAGKAMEAPVKKAGEAMLKAITSAVEKAQKTVESTLKKTEDEADSAVKHINDAVSKQQTKAHDKVGAKTEHPHAAPQQQTKAHDKVGARTEHPYAAPQQQPQKHMLNLKLPKVPNLSKVLTLASNGMSMLRKNISLVTANSDQFKNSLNAVQANLQAAFVPIYQAILPALNALMSGLAAATQAFASFMSAIFGKSYAQSLAAAKQMQSTAAAAKKTASGSDSGSGRSVAGFDEIHVVQKKDSGSGSDAGGINYDALNAKSNAAAEGLAEKFKAALAKINEALGPTKTALAGLGKEFERLGGFAWKGLVDFYNNFLVPVGKWTLGTGLPGFINAIRDGMAKTDWGKINTSLQGLWGALAPFAIHVGEGLLWFWTNVLVPLGTWTMNEVVPKFIDILSGAIKTVDGVIEDLKPIGKWLFDNFLNPLAEWTGGVISSVLKSVADCLSKIGDWVKTHKQAVQDIATVVGAFAAAWALVNVAIGIWNVAGAIAGGVTSAFGVAVASLTSPVTLVILAIGAVIAIVVLLVKHWDQVKAAAAACWQGIVNAWNGAGDWINKSVIQPIGKFFSDLWRSITGTFNNIGIWFGNAFSSAANGIRSAFSTIGNFFDGIWNGMTSGLKGAVNFILRGLNSMISGLNRIHFNIPDWLGGGSVGINIPKIPYLAKGGIVDQPTLSMIGEAGREAVVPLEKNTGGLQELASKLMTMMGGVGGIDYQKLYDTIVRALRDSQLGLTLYNINYEVLAKGLMKVVKEYYGDRNIPLPT